MRVQGGVWPWFSESGENDGTPDNSGKEKFVPFLQQCAQHVDPQNPFVLARKLR
jgi:hypothetical protein